MDNKFLSGFVAVAILALAGVVAFKDTTVVVNVPEQSMVAGNSSGQTESFAKDFQSSFFVGGRVATSTTSTTGTLLATSIENANVIDYTLNVADVTLTLPASSTIGFIRNVGDSKTFFVRNATTTATMDITFAAGTGINLKKATSSVALVGNSDGGNTAMITLIRQSDSDIDAIIQQFLD